MTKQERTEILEKLTKDLKLAVAEITISPNVNMQYNHTMCQIAKEIASLIKQLEDENKQKK